MHSSQTWLQLSTITGTTSVNNRQHTLCQIDIIHWISQRWDRVWCFAYECMCELGQESVLPHQDFTCVEHLTLCPDLVFDGTSTNHPERMNRLTTPHEGRNKNHNLVGHIRLESISTFRRTLHDSYQSISTKVTDPLTLPPFPRADLLPHPRHTFLYRYKERKWSYIGHPSKPQFWNQIFISEHVLLCSPSSLLHDQRQMLLRKMTIHDKRDQQRPSPSNPISGACKKRHTFQPDRHAKNQPHNMRQI